MARLRARHRSDAALLLGRPTAGPAERTGMGTRPMTVRWVW